MPISKELLEILACPKCKGDIFLNRKGDGLICKACHLLYPIKDDIPVMLLTKLFLSGRRVEMNTKFQIPNIKFQINSNH